MLYEHILQDLKEERFEFRDEQPKLIVTRENLKVNDEIRIEANFVNKDSLLR